MKNTLIISAAVAGFAGVSFAEGIPVRQSSKLYVSPAQLSQVPVNSPEFQLGFDIGSGEETEANQKVEADATGITANLYNTYTLPNSGLNIGLDVGYGTIDAEVKAGAVKTEQTTSTWIVKPAIAYTFAEFVTVGAQIEVETLAVEGDNDDAFRAEATRQKYTLGAAVNGALGEAGLAVTPAKEYASTDTATEITAHGRFFAMDNLAVGGILTYSLDSDVESLENNVKVKDANVEDAIELAVTGQYVIEEGTQVEAVLGYKFANYDEVLTVETADAFDINVNGDVAVAENVSVGGTLGLEIIEADDKGIEISATNISAAVRGAYLF